MKNEFVQSMQMFQKICIRYIKKRKSEDIKTKSVGTKIQKEQKEIKPVKVSNSARVFLKESTSTDNTGI